MMPNPQRRRPRRLRTLATKRHGPSVSDKRPIRQLRHNSARFPIVRQNGSARCAWNSDRSVPAKQYQVERRHCRSAARHPFERVSGPRSRTPWRRSHLPVSESIADPGPGPQDQSAHKPRLKAVIAGKPVHPSHQRSVLRRRREAELGRNGIIREP